LGPLERANFSHWTSNLEFWKMGKGQKHSDSKWNRVHNLRQIIFCIMRSEAGTVTFHHTESSEVMTHSLLVTKFQQLYVGDCNLERIPVRIFYNEVTFGSN
jgi:hypothetical protein